MGIPVAASAAWPLTLDFSLFKQFRMGTRACKFRAEAFNATNAELQRPNAVGHRRRRIAPDTRNSAQMQFVFSTN